MEQTLDIDGLMRAAAQAARRNDAAEAAALLRRALATQERAHGPDDVSLAPNLNNLAMMLERLGDNREAERCYRRAYDIARRAVGSADQMTVAARANLVEFLHATGKLDPLRDLEESDSQPVVLASADDDALRLGLDSFEPEPAASTPAPAPGPARPAATQPPPAATLNASGALELNLAAPPTPAAPRQTVKPPSLPPPVSSGNRRGPALILWLVLGAAAAGAVGWVMVSRGSSPAPANTASQPAPALPQGPPAATAVPDQTANAAPAAPAPPATTEAAVPPSAAETNRPAEPAPAAGAADGLAVEASLCQRLDRGGGSWRCDPLPDNGAADGVYFYTRIKSPRDVSVRHRWSHLGKPVQTVTLQVRANPREGYRTFSRQRVAGRPGQWEVALLSADGTVIETRQFTITK